MRFGDEVFTLQNFIFARNSMKCPDLYRHVMFANPLSPWGGSGIGGARSKKPVDRKCMKCPDLQGNVIFVNPTPWICMVKLHKIFC